MTNEHIVGEMYKCEGCRFYRVRGGPCPFCDLGVTPLGMSGPDDSTPTLFPLDDYAATKADLDADKASLGIDINGEPPMRFHTAIPMDQGEPRDADTIVPGFYRHYDAVSVQSDYGSARVPVIVDELDRRQIAYDVARECPVTASVVFRLVDGQVVAQLVSYVAFA